MHRKLVMEGVKRIMEKTKTGEILIGL